MPTTYSSLALELIGTGDQAGTWGSTTNSNWGAIEQAVAGMATLDSGKFTSNVATLVLSNTNGLQDARALVLDVTATLSGAGTVNVPAVQKSYLVFNDSVGGFDITVKVAGQTGVVVENGGRALVYCNGTDVESALSTTSYPLGTAILKANNGGPFANAVAGTDYVAPGTATTFTAKQTFQGAAAQVGASFQAALEKANIVAAAATGTIALNVNTAAIWYYTSAASANWTINIRGDGSNTLNSLMAVGETITCVFLATTGATPYFSATVQVDGSSVTPKWQGGVAPTSGNASSIEAYSYTVIKTASATFTVLASRTQFK